MTTTPAPTSPPKGLSYVPNEHAILVPDTDWVVPGSGERFPTPDLVGTAACLLPYQPLPGEGSHLVGRHVPESPQEHVRRQGRHVVEVRPGAVVLRASGGWRESGQAGSGRAEITAWSRKARSAMVLRLASLDYGPLFALGTPAMVTLTLPGDWLMVAPTGKAYKALVKAFWMRLERAYGVDSTPLVWKLEFQRRGAPHLHIFMVPPTTLVRCSCPLCPLRADRVAFLTWLSHNWADVVSHPDPRERANHLSAGTGVDYKEGARATDPKRLAVYFSKHGGAAGGKEYQHQVPDEWQEPGCGPGNFSGVRRLHQVIAPVPVPAADFVLIKRTLRRLSQRQAFYGTVGSRWPSKVERRTRQVRVPRGGAVPVPATWDVQGLAGAQLLERTPVQYRTVTRPVSYFANSIGGGFLLVNDGPALVSALARLERQGT